MKIANIEVGKGKTVIIAEVGINHNGQLSLAKKLVDMAVDCGVDIVKFQKRDLNSLYRKDVLTDPNKEGQGLQFLIPLLKEVELKDEEYKELFEYCKEKKVTFLCTPWDFKSVDFLESLGVEAYKVASADMTNFPLLEYIASKNKPMIISTGMADLNEIDRTVSFLKTIKAEFVLMHCNSTYPAPFYDLNLKFIQVMKERYKVPVGYSGHERGILMSPIAVALGADIIERHITLDRTMPGPDHAASIEPQGFARMVMDIRNTESSLGNIKKFTVGEGVKREDLGKSIVAAVDIKVGDILSKQILTVKSPGRGLSPQRLPEIYGKKALNDIKADTNLKEGDF
jgi:N-acetylneuraminate synthase